LLGPFFCLSFGERYSHGYFFLVDLFSGLDLPGLDFSDLPWVELRAVRIASSSVNFSKVANLAEGRVPAFIAACTAQ
jgi:hypothetical protein